MKGREGAHLRENRERKVLASVLVSEKTCMREDQRKDLEMRNREIERNNSKDGSKLNHFTYTYIYTLQQIFFL